MEWKAGKESRKTVVSILAEIISVSMVRKAKSGREIFHQLRNLLILDVEDNKKCPNGVRRGRYFLSLDGAITATVIIAVTWRINGCQSEIILAWLNRFSSGRGTCFHLLSASVESDGAWKASSAIFFHRQEAYLYHDGLKNLVPAHFSIAQKFISKSMDWKKLLFQGCSIAEELSTAPMVKQGKWIPSTRKLSQCGWNEKPGGSLGEQRFPSWQKLSIRRWYE